MSAIINPATGKPFRSAAPDSRIVRLREQIIRSLRARYDAAQTTSQNELHWINADELSPNSINRLSTRRKLRSRSRYEAANNGYLLGILLTIANDFVGSGPTLQITDQRFTPEQAAVIERRWAARCSKIKQRRKLRQLRFAKAQDGEGFAFSYIDTSLRDEVPINYRIFECDQVSHDSYHAGVEPLNETQRRFEIDGVRVSKMTGEPTHYHLLNHHPGESSLFSFSPGGKWFPASQVLHWFRRDRPWLRGIPETTATLPLWALLRRYTLAVVQNAEIAADFTVLLKSVQTAATTPFPLVGGEPSQSNPDEWFSSFPIDRGMMTVLPDMYDMKQLDPKQPVTMYDTFVNALVQEAARPLLCPRNLALGNSGSYNMSSGTLDRQFYRQSINQERIDCADEILSKDFDDWWFEAVRIPDYFYDPTDSIASVLNRFASLRSYPPDHTFRWDDVPEHSDPVKVAAAIDILHRAGHISDIDVQEGRFNRRVEDHYRNLERQNRWRMENWMPLEDTPWRERNLDDDGDYESA